MKKPENLTNLLHARMGSRVAPRSISKLTHPHILEKTEVIHRELGKKTAFYLDDPLEEYIRKTLKAGTNDYLS